MDSGSGSGDWGLGFNAGWGVKVALIAAAGLRFDGERGRQHGDQRWEQSRGDKDGPEIPLRSCDDVIPGAEVGYDVGDAGGLLRVPLEAAQEGGVTRRPRGCGPPS